MSGQPTDPSGRPPNVLLVMTDQHSAHMLGCAGATHVRTPHLDALVAQGTRFGRAYVTFPLCVPSRTSMMTGSYPHELDVHTNAPATEPAAVRGLDSLAACLGRADYRCSYAGKWHAVAPSADPGTGFEVIKDFGDDGLVEAVEKYLRTTADDERPFFLVASFDDPHTICEVARGQSSYYGALTPVALEHTPNLPSNFGQQPFEPEALRHEQSVAPYGYGTGSYTPEDWRHYRQAYADLVHRADANVGRLLGVLDDLDLADDTVVVFTSDHGDGDAAHGWNQKSALFEEIVRVPLIVRWPGRVRAAGFDTSLVSVGLDLLPTLCDVAGVQPPGGSRGRSLLPVLAEHGAPPRVPEGPEQVVVETGFGAGPRPRTSGRAVIEQRWKYVVYSWGQHREQLFDLDADPGEMVNLAVESAYGGVLQRFRRSLLDWCLETEDALFVKRLVLPDDVSPEVGRRVYAVPY